MPKALPTVGTMLLVAFSLVSCSGALTEVSCLIVLSHCLGTEETHFDTALQLQ